jgi:predicted secreted protein
VRGLVGSQPDALATALDMTRFAPLAAAAAALLSLTACGPGAATIPDAAPAAPAPAAPAPVELDAARLGQPVTLQVGQQLIVRLEANPTTGYQWTTTLSGPSVVAALPPEYTPSSTEPGIVGAGGVTTLRFTGQAPGSVRIGLTYERPWERGSTPPPQQGLVVTDDPDKGTAPDTREAPAYAIDVTVE